MSVDERLEELVSGKRIRPPYRDHISRLARAVLRARQDKGQLVSLMRSSLEFWPTKDHPKPCGEDMCWFCFLEGELEAAVEAAEAILDDPELEELLR